MSYDKVITNENGEEFPYSESFDSESYYYKISIVLDDRDGELLISKWGSHIEFDAVSYTHLTLPTSDLV